MKGWSLQTTLDLVVTKALPGIIMSDTILPKVSRSTNKKPSISTADFDKEWSVAKIKGALMKESLKTVKAEERTRLLRRLVMEGLGTNKVEALMKMKVNVLKRKFEPEGSIRN